MLYFNKLKIISEKNAKVGINSADINIEVKRRLIMNASIPKVASIDQKMAFSDKEKEPNRDSTYTLLKSSPLFAQKSDIIELSPAAIKKQEDEEKALRSISDNDTEKNVNGRQLTEEEKREIEKIRKNGRNVRRRELVYRAVVGNHVRGAASFQYDTGPDGIKYATDGHTSIDTRPVINNPEASIRKAQAIKRTKIDRSVAVEIDKMEREARQKLREEQRLDSEDAAKTINEEGSIDTTHQKRLTPELHELV